MDLMLQFALLPVVRCWICLTGQLADLCDDGRPGAIITAHPHPLGGRCIGSYQYAPPWYCRYG